MAFLHRGRKTIPFATLLLLSLFLILQPAVTCAANDPPSPVSITILHTNDMHGHLLSETDKKVSATDKVGGGAWMAAYVKRERTAHPGRVLLIDSGDIAQGTAISNIFYGKVMVEFMNLLGYDAGTIGNHEFDWGPQAFADMIAWAKRPIVCANLRLRKTHELPTNIRPFVIKKVNGIKIGITGLITDETPHISFKKNMAPFEFLSPTESLRKIIPEMRKAGAQAIVVASHLGEDADRQLARDVSGITAIIGGHSHSALARAEEVNGTIIVQAGKYMRFLGRLDLTIDPTTGRATSYSHEAELIPVLDAGLQPDPAVAALIKKYQDQVAPAMEQVLAEATADLTRKTDDNCADSAMGSLVADSMRWKAGTDIAVYNSGGVRTDLNKGPIKMAHMFELLPFDNFLTTMTLTGSQILTLLEQGSKNPKASIQVSGLTFTIGSDRKPLDVKVNGIALDPKKRYSVATVDFLAEGNDGLLVLKDGADRKVDELARDVFCAFVRKTTPLSPPPSGRIRIAAPAPH